MSKKANRPAWFKMFLNQKALIDSVPDDVVGRALKAALQYFETETVQSLDPLSNAVFASIKQNVDSAFEDFRETSERNRANVSKRWSQDNTGGSKPLPLDTKNTEDRGEKKEDRGEKKEGDYKADKPLRAHFIPPTVEQVAEYVKSRGSNVDPQGFVDFYTAKGWMVAKTPMKDWKAACRNSEHWERWSKTPDTRNRVKTDKDYEGGETFV